ncbi:MAG: hypothetical protein KatS3mg076_1556 [Candidatus Binatia bacterium]|nr:MAG: hypothetical protein KatS3mg076_1556 [Candidatus Binatia bacterium]
MRNAPGRHARDVQPGRPPPPRTRRSASLRVRRFAQRIGGPRSVVAVVVHCGNVGPRARTAAWIPLPASRTRRSASLRVRPRSSIIRISVVQCRRPCSSPPPPRTRRSASLRVAVVVGGTRFLGSVFALAVNVDPPPPPRTRRSASLRVAVVARRDPLSRVRVRACRERRSAHRPPDATERVPPPRVRADQRPECPRFRSRAGDLLRSCITGSTTIPTDCRETTPRRGWVRSQRSAHRHATEWVTRNHH